MFTQHQKLNGIHFFIFVLLLSMTPIRSSILITATIAQERCENAAVEAERMYDAGRFTQTVELLTECLPDGIPEIQRIGAYRLLALAYLTEDYFDEAKEVITKIFDLNRKYQADAVQDPQAYRDLVEEVRKNIPIPIFEKITGGWKKWALLGVTAGVVALVASNRGEDAQPLPDFP